MEGDAALKAARNLIKNSGPRGIKPKPIVNDAPQVDITKIHLSEPPNYKLGEKVCFVTPLVLF